MTAHGWPALPAERAGQAASSQLAARREALREAAADGTWRTGSAAVECVFGGLRTLCFRPPHRPRAVLLHLHGGGYRLGCPEMAGPFAAAVATRCGVEVLCPAYRLAPEHPMPAALGDGWQLLCALRQQAAGPLIVSGDSAGGGLAASLVALGVADGFAPAGLVLLSPWLDLTVSSRCYEMNAATDPLFSRAAAAEAAALYLQGVAAQHPLASPLFADLRGFPPTLVSIGEGEVLADDGRRFHAALCAAGMPSSLVAMAGMQHAAVTRGMAQPGAAETFHAVTQFIDRLVAAAST